MTNKPSSILTPKRQKRHKFKDAPEFKTLIARHKPQFFSVYTHANKQAQNQKSNSKRRN